MNIDTVKYFLGNPGRIVAALGSKGLLNWMPDKMYLEIVASAALGYKVDLDNPRTFNEKLNWLKIYDRKPIYTRMADKYGVRDYIAETIGEEYLIPLVGGPWDSFEEIDFDALPEEFVLKTTHDSGGVVICRDKAKFDIEAARKKLTWHLKREYFWGKREWPYKDVKPRIIAEKYMEDESGFLNDYKFWCFNGRAELCNVCTERFSAGGVKLTYLDRNWVKQNFERESPASDKEIERPDKLDLMLSLADKLSQGHAFLRVDFYEIMGRLYFGELTFYPGGSFTKFKPAEWDEILGSWIELPEKTK